MLAALIGLTIFGHSIDLDLEPKFGAEQVRHERIGQWRLERRTDRFTGQLACRLRARGMSYANDAVTFHFPQYADTANAVYRIDNRPAQDWADARWDAVRGGSMLNRGSLSHPTGGDVPIPLDYLQGASVVSVRATKDWSVRTYDLRGLPAAMERARQRGCDAKAFREPAQG